jgi:hypothetical protein
MNKQLNNNNKIRHKAKRALRPLESGGGALPTRTVNKHAGQRRQERQHLPSNLGEGKACNSGCPVESSTGVVG